MPSVAHAPAGQATGLVMSTVEPLCCSVATTLDAVLTAQSCSAAASACGAAALGA